MRRSLTGMASVAELEPTGVSIRTASPADAEALAVLMDDAYRGAIDAEPGQGLDDARREIVETFAGAYGAFMPEASFLASEDDEIVSACLVTRFEGTPIVTPGTRLPSTSTPRSASRSSTRSSTDADARTPGRLR